MHTDDDYEVYCNTCGIPHNNRAYEEGHPCRHKKHKVTPCSGKIQMTKPSAQQLDDVADGDSDDG